MHGVSPYVLSIANALEITRGAAGQPWYQLESCCTVGSTGKRRGSLGFGYRTGAGEDAPGGSATGGAGWDRMRMGRVCTLVAEVLASWDVEETGLLEVGWYSLQDAVCMPIVPDSRNGRCVHSSAVVR